MITDFLMLEVTVLHISMLLELLYINLCLSYGGAPAIICQCDAVAESFDGTLENFILNFLNLELLLKLADVVFFVRRIECMITTWANILALLAHVAPDRIYSELLLGFGHLHFCLLYNSLNY